MQAEAKKAGWPWCFSKGQDNFLPLSEFIDKEKVPDPYALTLSLEVDGKPRQHDSTGQMIFRIDELIEYCSSMVTLHQGDIICTGTPEGVGPVQPGNRVLATLAGKDQVLAKLDFTIAK